MNMKALGCLLCVLACCASASAAPVLPSPYNTGPKRVLLGSPFANDRLDGGGVPSLEPEQAQDLPAAPEPVPEPVPLAEFLPAVPSVFSGEVAASSPVQPEPVSVQNLSPVPIATRSESLPTEPEYTKAEPLPDYATSKPRSSGKVQWEYLPVAGPSPFRLDGRGRFDRAYAVDVTAFLAMLEKADRQREQRENPQDEQQIADAGGTPPPARPQAGEYLAANHAAQQEQPAQQLTTQQRVESLSASSAQRQLSAIPGAPAAGQVEMLDPELLLRYFDGRRGEDRQRVSVGVPFVMPYQSQAPLMMESGATYRQNEGGTVQGTSGR